jgi:hypothetical protein
LESDLTSIGLGFLLCKMDLRIYSELVCNNKEFSVSQRMMSHNPREKCDDFK